MLQYLFLAQQIIQSLQQARRSRPSPRARSQAALPCGVPAEFAVMMLDPLLRRPQPGEGGAQGEGAAGQSSGSGDGGASFGARDAPSLRVQYPRLKRPFA